MLSSLLEQLDERKWQAAVGTRSEAAHQLSLSAIDQYHGRGQEQEPMLLLQQAYEPGLISRESLY